MSENVCLSTSVCLKGTLVQNVLHSITSHLDRKADARVLYRMFVSTGHQGQHVSITTYNA